MKYQENNYIVLSDKNEIRSLINGFIFISSNEALKKSLINFSNKKGAFTSYIGFNFYDELDDYDKVGRAINKDTILFTAESPAVEESCEAYLSFDEFYRYLEDGINQMIINYPEKYNTLEIRDSLKGVKKSFGI